MLDPHDKRVFDDITARIRAEDPKFAQPTVPRRRLHTTMAILLWTIAPFCIVLGGWTGLFIAIAAAGYGANLMPKRPGMSGRTTDEFSWWSSGKRPGASL